MMPGKNLLITLSIILTACQAIPPKPDNELSAGDLANEYLRSKSGVRHKYDGKEITICGYVVNEVVLPTVDEHEGWVTLQEKDGSSFAVVCRFTRKESTKFASVKSGQFITVRGIFTGELGAELRFCRRAGLY